MSDNASMKKIMLTFCFAAGMSLTQFCVASGIDQLKDFGTQMRSARGTFNQTVLSKSGRKPQESSGRFVMQRPGKFRWAYDKPYPQLLISDGKTLWSFDPELNQVAIKQVSSALGATPAALLAGQALEKNFVLKNLPTRDGLELVEATPRAGEASFDRMIIGMRANRPVSMEIHDSFGQISLLVFNRFEMNPRLEANQFHFIPPAGADVLKE